MNARQKRLIKYIKKNKLNKLKDFISNNNQYINEFSFDFDCSLFDTNFKTTLLYYLFSHDVYDSASFILSNGFNVYKGLIFLLK
jgi:hypothetical protein